MTPKHNLQRFSSDGGPVFVTNPELRREYEILKGSGIYPLTDQPENARKLTLCPLRQYPVCANPLMLTGLTFGIIPGFLPGAKAFEYGLEEGGVSEHYSHRLPVYQRISVWEWLVRSDEDKVFTEALGWSTRYRLRDNVQEPSPGVALVPMKSSGR